MSQQISIKVPLSILDYKICYVENKDGREPHLQLEELIVNQRDGIYL